MKLLKHFTFVILIFLFSSCGTTVTIAPEKEFDLWNYMTSYSNYDVEYKFYHNSNPDGRTTERHIHNDNQYTRFHSDGTTTQLIIDGVHIVQIEPDGVQTNIIRYAYLGDKGIFQSLSIQLCSFDRFYETFQIHNSIFYNVIQISCTSKSGIYQEFYYGYNEGLVAFYQDNRGVIDESIKIFETSI